MKVHPRDKPHNFWVTNTRASFNDMQKYFIGDATLYRANPEACICYVVASIEELETLKQLSPTLMYGYDMLYGPEATRFYKQEKEDGNH